MQKRKFGVIFGVCSLFLPHAVAGTINVTLNTSTLAADAGDQPFALEFELDNGALIEANQPGGPHTSPSNIVTISNFSFGGGSAADPATDPAYFTDGGATGNLQTTVSLFANRDQNYLSQSFTPGSQLFFTVNYTNNVANSAILDSFNFGILDSNGFEVPTMGGDIFDSFLQIDFDSDVPDISTFASDPAAPTSAGEMLAIDAPDVSSPAATPEPGTLGILAMGLLFLLCLKLRSTKLLRSALSASATTAVLLLAAFNAHAQSLSGSQPVEYFSGTYKGFPVTYQIINGYAVMEGDMVIGEARLEIDGAGRRIASLRAYQNSRRPDSNSVNLASSLWPKVNSVVTVPYTITKGATVIMPAINAFNSLFSGKFQWVPRTNQKNYVDINLDNQSLNSCFASRGYVGGKEIIQGPVDGCGLSANMHEMGHIMGFSHEQSRQNRNTYIAINFADIAPAEQSQYSQDFSDSMDLGLYDYGSLMHYGPRGFSRDGNPEMESIPTGIPFGDPPTFSAGDIDALNRLYFTAPSQVTITSLPSGLQVIVDGGTYTTPRTFAWTLNSPHTLNVPSGPQTIGGSNYIFGRWNSDVAGDLNPSRTITISPGSGMLGSPVSAPAYTVYAANFIQLALYNPISVLDNNVSTPAAAGTVSTNPAPSTFPGLTGQYFVNRKLVTLTANPVTGNSFYSFAGPNTFNQNFGPAASPLTLPSDLIAGTLYTNFTSQPEVDITTSVTNNNASGTVVAADGAASVQLPVAFSQPYDSAWTASSTHSLTVSTPVSPFNDPHTQYTFTSWSDGATSPTRSVTVPASGVLALGVNYSTAYFVSANVNSACAGSVAVNPPPPANGFVPSGTPLSLSATPTSPFVFAGWSGTVSGTANPLSTSATGEVIGTAVFNLIPSPLAITSISPSSLPVGSPAQSITINGTGFTPTTSFYLMPNYMSRTVTYVNPNTVTVALLASDLSSPAAIGTVIENSDAANVCLIDVYGPSFLATP